MLTSFNLVVTRPLLAVISPTVSLLPRSPPLALGLLCHGLFRYRYLSPVHVVGEFPGGGFNVQNTRGKQGWTRTCRTSFAVQRSHWRSRSTEGVVVPYPRYQEPVGCRCGWPGSVAARMPLPHACVRKPFLLFILPCRRTHSPIHHPRQ